MVPPPPPKGVYLTISKLHSILAIANLLAHYNITTSYYGQVNSLLLKSSVASKWASKLLWGVPFILLVMVHQNEILFPYLYGLLQQAIINDPGGVFETPCEGVHGGDVADEQVSQVSRVSPNLCVEVETSWC